MPRKVEKPTFVIGRGKFEVNIDHRRLEQRKLVALQVDEIVSKILPHLKRLKAMKLDDDGTRWSNDDIVDMLGLR